MLKGKNCNRAVSGVAMVFFAMSMTCASAGSYPDRLSAGDLDSSGNGPVRRSFDSPPNSRASGPSGCFVSYTNVEVAKGMRHWKPNC